MKQDNVNYFLVGSFMIVTAITFFGLLYAITGKIADADVYYTVLYDVSGVNEGSSVTYNGFRIGQISDILPTHENGKTRFRLTLKVKSDWKITVGSKAMIASQGLLSDSQIEITEGESSDILKPGSVIDGGRSDNIMLVIRSLGQQINKLTSDLIVPFVSKLKDDVGQFSGTVNTQLPKLTSNINLLVDNLQKNSKAIDVVFSDSNQKNISQVISQTKDMMNNLNTISNSLNTIVDTNKDEVNISIEKINSSVNLLNNKLEQIFLQLESGSRNINDFSHQIKNNPGLILRSKPVTDPAVR